MQACGEAFDAAAEQARRGDPRGAASSYETLAKRCPDSALADDALAAAAELRERTAEPEAALRLHTELLARYPESRLAGRAQARLAFLRENLTAGVEPLRQYLDLIAHAAERPIATNLAAMEQLLRDHPAFPAALHLRYWRASLLLEQGRYAEALAGYDEVIARAPGSEWGLRAQKARGDVLVTQRRFSEATEAYRVLAGRGGEWQRTAEEGVRRAESLALRRSLSVGAGALFVLILVLLFGSLLRARRRIRLPLELVYFLPVALAFVAAAATEHGAIFVATTILAVAGALLTFAIGQRPPAPRPLLGLATLVAVACAFYVAIESQGLFELLRDTVLQDAHR